MAELSNVLNRMERPTVGSKDNKAVFEGTFETAEGVNFKVQPRGFIISDNDVGTSSKAYMPINVKGTITKFHAVIGHNGTGGAETLIVSLLKEGSPDVAIGTSTITFNNNSSDGLTNNVSPTGAIANFLPDEVLVFEVTGSLPANWAVSVMVEITVD